MSKLFYALYDLANSAYTIIVVTFIMSAYFANQIVGDPQIGQRTGSGQQDFVDY